MLHVIEHAFLDSLKVFVLVFILFLLLNFIEKKVNKKLSTNNNKLNPLIGSLFGLIPQCGVSVAASDLYLKRKITIGTLMAVFIACNDEAIFVLLASDKLLYVFPLLFFKLFLGFIFGILLDALYFNKQKLNKKEEVNVECCHHNHHHSPSKNKFTEVLLHNLFHSLEVFIYVLVVNLLFGTIIYYIGENNIILFLEKNKYLSPLFATIIGVIPNCASSIVLAELFIINGISFGTLLGGLTINAGLGLIYLFKKKENLKNNIFIVLALFFIALLVGYLTCFIIGF